MIIDVFLKVNVADVKKFTEEELYTFISSQIFGGLINVKNPFEKKNIFEKVDLFVKPSDD